MSAAVYPSKYSEMLFEPEKMKAAITRRVFGGDRALYEKHASWALSDDVLEGFLEEYLGDQTQFPRGDRPYDIVVYGASGYTGELTFEYLVRSVTDRKLRVALAGRSEERLGAMRDKVLARNPDYAGLHQVDLMRADLSDPHDIRKIVLSCDVVINIAGPFMLTGGEMLVEACIQYECDYVDVNGEVPYTHKLLEYHDIAKATGTIVVPNAAFAGGATDVCTWFAAQSMRERHGERTRQIRGYVSASEGAVPSGGTLATREAMNAALRDVGQIMSNPFALGGLPYPNAKRPEDQDKTLQTHHAPEDPVEGYCGPFMYAFFETRVVRRSNMLMQELGGVGESYGPEFNFQQWALFQDKAQADKFHKASTSSKDQEEALKKEGKLFEKGDGLGAEERAAAWSRYYFFARSAGGRKLEVRLEGVDAYEETGHMAVEVALSILWHRKELSFQGGVLTPGVAGGHVLVKRLNDSGMKIYVADEPGASA